MTTGQKIRAARKQRGLTQKELGALLGVSAQAIGQFETSTNTPKIDTLDKISTALNVPISYLIATSKPAASDICLDQKLSHIGYSVGFDEEDGYLWLNYPDGTLEITEAELDELNNRANEYLRFLLHDLKEKKIENFKMAPVKKEATHGND